MADGDQYHIAGNLSPARAAVKLIATADQALLIDAWAVARVSAGDTEGTITAWIMVPDITGDYDNKAPDDITGTSGDLTDWWDMKDDFVNRVTAANGGTAGASLKLVNAYSEFSSRMAFMTGTPVVADDISISVTDGIGHGIVIKAA